MSGKNLALDHAGMRPVVNYEGVLVAPINSTNSQVRIPAGYLRVEFGSVALLLLHWRKR